MVPWRATEEGYVTEDIIEWYERFARGMPGAIVVEATGIRDVRSGPLLRIGHDRFLPGLRRLVETVRRASEGRTRLLIQLIDFLTIRRRPEPKKFFERFLAVTDRHRAALGEPELSDAEVRARLSAMSDDELARVLTPAEREALEFGYRERVTDTEHAHIRDLPRGAADAFRRCRRARRAGRVRRRRAALRARLYDGLVPVAHQHPRRRLRRIAGEPRAPSARSLRRSARPGRQGICGRLPVPGGRMHRWRQRCR